MADMEGLGGLVRKRIHARFADVTDVITPVTPNVRFKPRSTEVLEAAQTIFGDLGEKLYTHIYGGEVASEAFPDVDPRRLTDAINVEQKIFAEVKWCRADSQLQLRDSQVEYWKELQALYPDWRMEFFFMRHGIEAIKTYGKTETELHKDIAQRPIYGVKLTLDLILQLHGYHRREVRTGQKHRYVRSYEERAEPLEGTHTYETCACLKIGGLNAIIEKTNKIFPKEEPRVAWLRGMTINRRPMEAIPIVEIYGRNYDSWRARHASKYHPPANRGEDEGPVDRLVELLDERYGIRPARQSKDDVPF